MHTRNEETYRGYQIIEVFKYTFNGKSDFEVYHGDQEKGTLFHKKTLEEVRENIDLMIEENSND